MIRGYLRLNSLRGKITSAYITLVASTILLGIIAFSDLLFLERQIVEGKRVSDLKESVLEMRREEKNLFLYQDPQALTSADQQAAVSLATLDQHIDLLSQIMPKAELRQVIDRLTEYREYLEVWNRTETNSRHRLQDELRDLGHQITLAVSALAERARSLVENAVRKSQWLLLLSLLLIGLSIYIVGRQMKRVAVTPLKQLESHLMPIARGRFNHLQPPSSDREFVTFTDALNRMLKELEVRQKRMLQSEKLASLGILAAGVAHELNNPLSNISSSCQLLMEELHSADSGQLETWLRQIDSETERGRQIVRSLLDFGSQRNFKRRPQRLLQLIHETRPIIGKTLSEQAVDLQIDVPEELTLSVDKQRFQQLLINLIQNALHAGGQGVRITISARTGRQPALEIPDGAEVAGNLQCVMDFQGRFIRIQIEDDGPGIAGEHLSRIFDPFFTTSDTGHGAGLGLFIAQEIVREHDGCLAITSLPGRGTRVIALLPDETGSVNGDEHD